jgi:hypothetical protein
MKVHLKLAAVLEIRGAGTFYYGGIRKVVDCCTTLIEFMAIA